MRRRGWVALALFAAGVSGPYASSQEMTYKNEAEEAAAFNVTRTTKTVAGLHFQVEEDRPIEKVGSIYRPVDIDSYVAYKFNKLQQQMQELIDALSDRVVTLEKEVAALNASQTRLNATVASILTYFPSTQPPAANVTVTSAPASNQTVS